MLSAGRKVGFFFLMHDTVSHAAVCLLNPCFERIGAWLKEVSHVCPIRHQFHPGVRHTPTVGCACEEMSCDLTRQNANWPKSLSRLLPNCCDTREMVGLVVALTEAIRLVALLCLVLPLQANPCFSRRTARGSGIALAYVCLSATRKNTIWGGGGKETPRSIGAGLATRTALHGVIMLLTKLVDGLTAGSVSFSIPGKVLLDWTRRY